jgi:polysaccharide pyruvyl transferase WcaK-like protein
MTDPIPKRIGILGATFETPNLGVSALAAGSIRCLRFRYPNAHFFFLDYAHRRTVSKVVENGRTIRVPLLNMRFSKRIWLPNNIVILILTALILKVIPSPKVKQWFCARNHHLREICRGELFAAVSGGDSFSDMYGLGRFFYVSLPQILVLLLGKRLILLPQTYGPFDSRLAKFIARKIVSHAERAFCRDRHSLAQLMNGTGNSTARWEQAFCYDMAFGIDSDPPHRLRVAGLSLPLERDASLIGLNVSGLLYREDHARPSAFGLHSNYRALIPSIIELLLASEDTTVLLVPHVFGTETGGESDAHACEEVFAALKNQYPGRLGILRGSYGPTEIRYTIGRCGFFIGSRMHACIAALSQGIPAVAIAYSDKFLGVMDSVGAACLAADARTLNDSAILAAIRFAFENRQSVENELKSSMPAVRFAVHHMLERSQSELDVIQEPLPWAHPRFAGPHSDA